MAEAVVTQLPRTQLGAQFFCNLDVIDEVLDDIDGRDKEKRACMFYMLRCFINQRVEEETGSSQNITRSIVVYSKNKITNNERFVTGPNDADYCELMQTNSPHPDEFIFTQVLKLRNTHVILLVETIPQKDWWRAIECRNVAVTIVRKRENMPAMQEHLILLGAFAAFPLKNSANWTTRFTTNHIPRVSLLKIAQPFHPDCFGDDFGPPATLEQPAELIAHKEVIIPEQMIIHDEEDNDPRQKLVIVIDGANINATFDTLVVGERHKDKLDFRSLRTKLTGDRRLIGCYYVARVPYYPEPYDGVRSFYHYLTCAGFQVIAPKTEVKPGDDWDDREIRAKLPKWAAEADVIVLASGDGGYTNVLTQLASDGKKIEILAMPENLNPALPYNNFLNLKELTGYGQKIPDDIHVEPSPNYPAPIPDLIESQPKQKITLTLSFTCLPSEVADAITQLTSQIEKLVGSYSPDYRFQRKD